MSAGVFRIVVVGGWHQASVLSACFAELGHTVTGIADDALAVDRLNQGCAPVHEPGLDRLLRRNIEAGRLSYTTSYTDALKAVDFVFLSIDTPVGKDDDSDLASIFGAAEQIAKHAAAGFTLCVTAQVPVGTCDMLGEIMSLHRGGPVVSTVYVPEFLRLGDALRTFREPDRTVIGADDAAAADRVASLYAPLRRPIHRTTVRSAEMAKHASNAFLATSISFINEIADLCEVAGADLTEVAAIMKLDRRIGKDAFLSAGVGYAGGTLGRETRALRGLGNEHGTRTDLLDAVDLVNSRRVERVAKRVRSIHPQLKGLRVGVLGLTYKAGTSTLRRSAALELIRLLVEGGAAVAAFDPLARWDEQEGLPPFHSCNDPLAAAADASALVLVAPWPDMDQYDFRPCVRVMRSPVLVDTGNFLSPAAMASAGFQYFGVGR
jgi:UDPglucose 6-dehydrogenase